MHGIWWNINGRTYQKKVGDVVLHRDQQLLLRPLFFDPPSRITRPRVNHQHPPGQHGGWMVSGHVKEHFKCVPVLCTNHAHGWMVCGHVKKHFRCIPVLCTNHAHGSTYLVGPKCLTYYLSTYIITTYIH